MGGINLTELYTKIYTPEVIQRNVLMRGTAEPMPVPYIEEVKEGGEIKLQLVLPYFSPRFRIEKTEYDEERKEFHLFIKEARVHIMILPTSVKVVLPSSDVKEIRVEKRRGC